jgi:competence protein ComEC
MLDINYQNQQGDAHLITSKDKAILIDAGHIKARRKLIKELNKRRIKRLNAVFITHPHNDHYGGLLTLIRSNVKIDVIYMNDVSEEWMASEWWGGSIEELNNIRNAAKCKHIPIKDYTDFDEFIFSSSFKMEKLFAFTEEQLTNINIGPDVNELSLLSKVTYNDYSVLFTGDLNTPLSNWLMNNCKEQFKCDILKVPHHGASGLASNAFFENTNAKIGLIPAPEWLWNTTRCNRTKEVLAKMNCATFVNGLVGTINVVFSNNQIKILPKNSYNYMIFNK